MKKTITILAILGLFILQSCTIEDDSVYVDNDTISEVFEVTTSFNATNGYSKLVTLNPPIFNSDVVLVYRLSGVTSQGNDIWKLLPETHFYSNGTLNFGYNFDFTKNDISIYMVGNDLQTVISDYKLNQVLRIVIVPASFSTSIDKNNFEAVISALNIKVTNFQKI